MKKKNFKILLLVMMLFISSILSACNKKEDAKKNEPAAMGRYVETENALPENLSYIVGFHQNKNKDLELLGMSEYQFVAFTSEDNGLSWKDKDISYLTEFYKNKNGDKLEYSISAAAWDKEDKLYLYFDVYSTKNDDYKFKESKIGYLDDSGKISFLDYSLKFDGGVSSMKITSSGDFILEQYFSLSHINGKTGEVIKEYKPTDKTANTIDNYDIFEDTLTFSSFNTVYSYNLASKEEIGKFSPETFIAPKASTVTYSDEYKDAIYIRYDASGSLYFINKSGLYHCINNNTMFEKMIDGNLSSLGIPTVKPQSLFINDDKFLVLNHNDNKFNILNYEYDATIPTLPSTELTIYSLNDNQTLRQSIGMFLRSHPEVHITLEIGLGDGVRKENDERKRLTSAMMAGNGPDIIIMDSLPLKSFEQKALLLDLKDTLNKQIQENQLLSNIALAYQNEDKTVYTVPARFEVPMILGDAKAIDSIQSLSDLRQWLTDNVDSNEYPLNIQGKTSLLKLFYPVCASSLLAEDGKLSKEGLLSFLEDVNAIGDIGRKNPEMENKEVNFDFDSLYWMNKIIAFDIANVNFFEATYAPYTTLLERKEGKVSTLFGKGTFIPNTLMSVNVQSDQKELALSFIEYTLSETVLTSNFNDGLPVSQKALENNKDYRRGDGSIDSYSFYSTSLSDEDPIMLDIKYPSKEFSQDIFNQLTSASVKSEADTTILSILLEETKTYFNGNGTLDHTVSIIADKVNTYLSEQN